MLNPTYDVYGKPIKNTLEKHRFVINPTADSQAWASERRRPPRRCRNKNPLIGIKVWGIDESLTKTRLVAEREHRIYLKCSLHYDSWN